MADPYFDPNSGGTFLGNVASFLSPLRQNGFDFRINPSNYLGINNERFKSDMLQLALSKPTQYFNLRKAVLSAVKAKAVNDIYAIYYWLLTEGNQTENGQNRNQKIIAADQSLEQETIELFTPKLPPQLVNEFALKAAKTIDKIAEEAIELILPMNYKSIADDRTTQRTAGTLGFDNTL
jgi:hypothetical protein